MKGQSNEGSNVMPGKTALKTDWIKLGTAGETIDGRTITEQDILDMAETYDQEEYTASINYEHYGFDFGEVIELKTGRSKGGDIQLLGVLSPNHHMLNLNASKQKMFPSMEVFRNFRKKGKSYLSGLALTDKPASSGTSKINFSKRAEHEPNQLFSKSFLEPLDLSLKTEDDAPGWFTKFISTFSQQPAAPAASNPQEDDDMTQEQIEALTASISAGIDAKFAAIEQKLSAAPSGDGEDPAPGEQTPGAAVFSNEQATELQNTVKTLGEQVTALSSKLEKLSATPAGDETPTPTGDEQAKVY